MSNDISKNSFTWLGLMVTGALLCIPMSLTAYESESSDYLRDLDRALGIGSQFGRWNSVITLVYDPDGAPALFSDTNEMLAFLEEAAGEWELVSGIRFNVASADSAVPNDDGEDPEDKDGLVRVHWTNIGGASGRAGPDGDYYDDGLGYFPYIDGSVQLNENPDTWDYKEELLPVLVHEFGHLMGLGHSDNPDSVMFANPYNHLRHPRADDILAARALYGDGTLVLTDVAEPLEQWLFEAPAQANESDLEYLFTANQFADHGAYISVNSDTPVSEINESTTDSGFVRFNFGGIGNFDNTVDIDLETTIYIVDPFGYLYEETDWEIECGAGAACDGGWVSLSTALAMKTIPGEWTVHIVDDDSGLSLLTLPFDVNTTPDYNRAPKASVALTRASSTSLVIELLVEDPENNDVEVIWHPFGNLGDQDSDGFLDTEVRDAVRSGGTVGRVISFNDSDDGTIYIELVDDQPRYDGGIPDSSTAGSGFQNLIAVEVSLPIPSNVSAQVRTSFLTDDDNEAEDAENQTVSQAVIETIASSEALKQPTRADRSASKAAFSAGASADDGVTLSNIFQSGDTITIAGSVIPEMSDIGKAGELFVVLYSITDKTSLTYLDLDGVYNSWNGNLQKLAPAFEIDSLGSMESFEVFTGQVQSGLYRVFLGYSTVESGMLNFNFKAFRVEVD